METPKIYLKDDFETGAGVKMQFVKIKINIIKKIIEI
jgi:hypothetical protein